MTDLWRQDKKKKEGMKKAISSNRMEILHILYYSWCFSEGTLHLKVSQALYFAINFIKLSWGCNSILKITLKCISAWQETGQLCAFFIRSVDINRGSVVSWYCKIICQAGMLSPYVGSRKGPCSISYLLVLRLFIQQWCDQIRLIFELTVCLWHLCGKWLH